MSARRIASTVAAIAVVLAGSAACGSDSPQSLQVGTSASSTDDPTGVPDIEAADDSPTPLAQPTEEPEGGNGTVPRRTDHASVPADSVLGNDVLGPEWNVTPDQTELTAYDVSLCDPTLAGTPLAQRTRTLTDTMSHASVTQQVRVYDEAAAERVIGAIRAALTSCAGPTVNGRAVDVTEEEDPRFGDESFQALVRSADGAEATWLVLRLHEAVSATLITDGDSGDREGLTSTIGDLAVSTLCAATTHGCES